MVQRTYGKGPLGGLAMIVCSVHARMLVVDGTEAVRYPWVSLCFLYLYSAQEAATVETMMMMMTRHTYDTNNVVSRTIYL